MVDTRFYENHGPFTLAQVAEICDARVEDASKADVEVRELATMSAAAEGDICFFMIKTEGQSSRNPCNRLHNHAGAS